MLWFLRRRRRREAPVAPPRFIQPLGLHRHRFVQIGDREDAFEVWRDDRRVVGSASGFTLQGLTAQYLEEERKEREAADAVRSGDRRAPCRLGWHRERHGMWCRCVGGWSDAMWIYRVGRVPVDGLCTTIWSYGNQPIRCVACGLAIDRKNAKLGP